MVADVLRVAARASLTVTARASSTAMTGVRVVMMAIARVVRASLTVTARAMIAVRASLIAMTGAHAAMMATARAMIAVRASLIAMTGVRVVMIAIARAARASLTVMTVVVRASSTAMTGARAALIAAIATSRSVRRPRRIVDAQRCSSARVVVSTAKTTRVRLAVMTSGRSSTRARCADRERVMFAATSGVQPTSALAINDPQIEETEMIGETGDINFLPLVHSKSNWPKRSVAPSVTDASLMSAARWVQLSMRMTVNDGVMRRSCWLRCSKICSWCSMCA
jgi:hypothetical protein